MEKQGVLVGSDERYYPNPEIWYTKKVSGNDTDWIFGLLHAHNTKTVLVRITIENNKVKLTPLGFVLYEIRMKIIQKQIKYLTRIILKHIGINLQVEPLVDFLNNNFELDGYGIKNIQFTYNKTSVKNFNNIYNYSIELPYTGKFKIK